MKKIMEIISYLSLALLVATPVLFFAEKVSLQTNKNLMLAATIVWFSSALFWMGREKDNG